MIRRRTLQAFLVGAALLSLGACIRLKPKAVDPGTDAQTLTGIPVVESGVERCAAASLAGVATYWGRPVATDELHRRLPKGEGGGVLSIDVLLAARELGFESELVSGDRELIQASIESGRPLILMLQIFDAPGRSRDLFHYVVVDGVAASDSLVRVHFGDGEARWVPLAKISRAWADTDYATILITPGSRLSRETDPIRYAVALEEAGYLAEAEAVYLQWLETHPDSALAWLNLGNVRLERGRLSVAEQAYRESLELDPDQVDALNNLAWLLLTMGGDLTEARTLARSAVVLGGPDPYLALDTLGRIDSRLGSCDKAQTSFERALATAPLGSDTRAWILYGLALAQRDCGNAEASASTLQRARVESADDELNEKIEAALASLQ